MLESYLGHRRYVREPSTNCIMKLTCVYDAHWHIMDPRWYRERHHDNPRRVTVEHQTRRNSPCRSGWLCEAAVISDRIGRCRPTGSFREYLYMCETLHSDGLPQQAGAYANGRLGVADDRASP